MIQARAWPVRAMYILIAVALAISLFITAAPAQKVSGDCTADVCAEWERVSTPTVEDWTLAPESMILDYALDSAGEVAYAVVYSDYDMDGNGTAEGFCLLKSDDHAATWEDITDNLEDALDTGESITMIKLVATDWEDPDFVAVALTLNVSTDTPWHVFFSTDGGDEFEDTGEVEDGGAALMMVSDLAVSYEAAGDRDIAIGGIMCCPSAALFRCTVTGDSASAWEDTTDTTDYEGWDNKWPTDLDPTDDLLSWVVTDIIFSPSWATDKTILVTTVAHSNATGYQGVYLQSGSWGTSEGWNYRSTLGIDAVPIKTNPSSDVQVPMMFAMIDARGIAGLTLPEDYNSKNDDARILWVWVNYYDALNNTACSIMRVDDDSAGLVGPMGQIEDGEIWLTNIAYQGTIAEGEAMAGVLGIGDDTILTACCEGVQVYRNAGIVNMDICCIRWENACKPPTGTGAMAVSYVGDDKAYAVALLGVDDYEEGAWSVTFDDGDTWNQLSLIDTHIDYLSDVAVSPDCNKVMLASVNDGNGCGCDSVWLHAEDLPEAEEYSGTWIRTWCGLLEGNNNVGGHGSFPWVPERGLLRLNPEETTGDTVFLVDRRSGNVYWNDLEGLACWDPISSTEVDDIVDLVALDADTLYALDWNGDVSIFDEDEWQEAVDSEVTNGWTIAVWGNNATHVLVGGQNSDVSYSDDGGETFTELEDVAEASNAHVTVAFDSYFDQNDVVYAALANGGGDNGIYILVIDGETADWHKLAAEPHNYTGLVLDRADGNPWTSPETGGVLYASYRGEECDGWCGYDSITEECWDTGVARCLTPIVEICCDVGEAEWNYLTWDLCWENSGEECADFRMPPQALKICGCLSADTNSHLFAIDLFTPDGPYYDMDEGLYGTVWTFEDCYAKKGVELVSPDDGFVVGVDSCDCCNAPFALRWDRLCDACCYEIEFATDEDFTDIYYYDWFICPDTPTEPMTWVGCDFDPEFTYYWRVRAVEAETCQDIYSWWSEVQSFTVSPMADAASIDLVAPEAGATGVPTKNVGFSWKILATADAFDWVLSKNADLSAPVDSKTGLSGTATTYTGTMDYGTTYFWQVTAYNEGAAISSSAVGTFTTAAQGAFCCPQCGLCFDTQAELQAHVDAEHAMPATPFWVWIVIAIGAVLVIVVIVLIFRTRRV